MTREIEFTIELPPNPIKEGRIRVAGRCCKSAIILGDRFDKLYRLAPARSLEDYELPRSIEKEESVSIRIDSITAYRQNLERLDSGLTAELELFGDGTEKIKLGWILYGLANELPEV